MSPQSFVLFVEGESELESVPILVERVLASGDDGTIWQAIALDRRPFRVGGISSALRMEPSGERKVIRLLRAARSSRPGLGAVLLLLDGDWPESGFCAARIAQDLAREAREAGAGSIFSFASVFAIQEIESWLIAGIEDLDAPGADLERSPRDAKGWLSRNLPGGYRGTRDQASLARRVDLERIRSLRSFRRFESAVKTLAEAIRSGRAVVSPTGDSTSS